MVKNGVINFRCNLTNARINYLRVCVFKPPQQCTGSVGEESRGCSLLFLKFSPHNHLQQD